MVSIHLTPTTVVDGGPPTTVRTAWNWTCNCHDATSPKPWAEKPDMASAWAEHDLVISQGRPVREDAA